jgi:HTH-type transcriptional regulator / antitoxin MqsA
LNTLNKKSVCPACDSESLVAKTGAQTYKYKNKAFTLDNVEFSMCENCGVELMMPVQHKENAKLVLEYKKQIEGLLSASDIKSIRKKLGLTQIQAAEIFGGGVNSFSKYERSEIMQSSAMDKFLRLVDSLSNSNQILQSISSIKVHSLNRGFEYTCHHHNEIVKERSRQVGIYKLESSNEVSNSEWHEEYKVAI